MRKIKNLLALLLAAAMMLSACAFAEDTQPQYLFVGDKAADFTVTMSDGSTVTLTELLKTKEMVLLNFWATWCGPCVMEFPYMQEAYDKFSDKVAIVALSVEPGDSDDVINQFKTDNGLSTLPLGQDSTGVSDNYYFDGIPTSIVIDRFGVICWQESGSITSADKFERLFNGFLGDDYTESKVGYVIPGPKPTVANASEEDLSAAMNAEGGSLKFYNSDADTVWPFIPTESGALKNSNTGIDETTAAVYTTVNAKAGDALAFDYAVSSEACMDYLKLSVNDAYVTILSGDAKGTYAYSFAADGEYKVELAYVKDPGASEGDDCAIIDNARLLSGEEAAAAVAAMPTYPLSLEGTEATIVPVDGKEMLVSEPSGMYDMQMGTTKSYVANGNNAAFEIKLGKDLDPAQAVVYGDFDGVTHAITSLEQTEDGFLVTLPLSSVEAGGYSNTYVYLYPAIVENPQYMIMLYVYANEENANRFVYNEMPGYGMPDATWTYADGSVPATDAIAEPPAAAEVPEGYAEYAVYFLDQDGNPVANVMAQVCDAETCQVMPSDENGAVVAVLPSYAYEIHALTAPEGYTVDTEKIYVMPIEGGEIVIPVTKN